MEQKPEASKRVWTVATPSGYYTYRPALNTEGYKIGTVEVYRLDGTFRTCIIVKHQTTDTAIQRLLHSLSSAALVSLATRHNKCP